MFQRTALFLIDRKFVRRKARFIGYFISSHRKFFEIEFDGEWNVWITKEEHDRNTVRKLGTDIWSV